MRLCGGVALVIGAIFLYGGKSQTPQELCESLCGTCCGGNRSVEPAEDGAMLVQGVEEADDIDGRATLGQSLSGDEAAEPSPAQPPKTTKPPSPLGLQRCSAPH